MIANRIFHVLALVIILALLVIAMPAKPALAQAITLTPSSGKPGSTVIVSGLGFAPDSSYQIFFASGTPYIQTKSGAVANTGFFSDFFIVPKCPKGDYDIWAQTSAEFATNVFKVIPGITLNALSASVGQQVTVNGSGFVPGTNVTVIFDTTVVGIVSTDADGSFTTTFTVPPSSLGSHTIKAMDGSNNYDTASLTIQRSVTLTPTSGAVDSEVTISGYGFRVNQSVSVTYNNVAVTTSPESVTTDSNGGFSAKFNVPPSSSGTYKVIASDGVNTGEANFAVVASFSIGKTSGRAGDEVTFSGKGFKAIQPVNITFAGAPVKTITADATGGFSDKFTVPAVASGTYKVSASDGVNTGEDNFAVVASFSVGKTSGRAGDEVTFSGKGVNAKQPVNIT